MKKQRGNFHKIEALKPNGETRDSTVDHKRLLLVAIAIACCFVVTITVYFAAFVPDAPQKVANKTVHSRQLRALGSAATSGLQASQQNVVSPNNLNPGPINNANLNAVVLSTNQNQPNTPDSNSRATRAISFSGTRVLQNNLRHGSHIRTADVINNPPATRVLQIVKSTGQKRIQSNDIADSPSNAKRPRIDSAEPSSSKNNDNRVSFAAKGKVNAEGSADQSGTPTKVSDSKIAKETEEFFGREEFKAKSTDDQFQELLTLDCWTRDVTKEMPDSIFKNHWNKVKAQLKVLKKKEVYAYDYKRHLIQEWIEDQKANNPDFDVDIYKSQQNSPYNTAAVIRTMTNYLNGEKFSNVDLVGQLLLLQNIDHKKPLSTQPQEFKDFAYNLWRYMTLSQQKSLRQIKIHLISLFLKLHDDYEFPGKFVFEAQKQHIISWLEGKTKEEVDGYELPTAKNKKVRNALMELRDELQELNVNWGRSFTYERPPEFKAHVKSLMVDGDAKQHSVFGFLSKEIEDFLGAFDIDVVMQWTEETPEFRLFIQNARKIASANRVSDANLSKASNPLSRLKRIRATMFKKETGKHYVFDQNPGRYRHVEWNEESDAIFCRYIDEGMQMIKVNSQRLLEDIRKAMDNQELSPRQIFERLAQLQSIDELWKSKEMIRRLNVYVSEAPAESFSHQSSPTTDLFHRLCEKVWQSADEKDIRRPTADRIHAQTVMFMNAKNQRDPNYKTVDTKLYAFVSQNMNLTDDEWAETELSDLTNEVNDVLRLENPNYRLVQVAEVRGRSNYMRAALQVLNDNRHFQGTGIPIPVRNLLVYSTEEYTSLTLTRINDPNQS